MYLSWSGKTSSVHYYRQPFILAEAMQASAMKSCPKLIRLLLQSWDFRKNFQKILICVWEEGWMMFFLHAQFYWSFRNCTNCSFISVIFQQSGFRSKYQKHYFCALLITEDTVLPFWGSCWCLHCFELPRNLEYSSKVMP